MKFDLKEIESQVYDASSKRTALSLLIKGIAVSEFDKLAIPIAKSIQDSIDCTTCGNCCKVQEPGISFEEMEVMASELGMEAEGFKDKYIAWDKNGVSFICSQPCPMLQDKICKAYASRPQSCKDYPGLTRSALKWRWKQVEANYSICPIVFHFVNRLEKELGA